MLKKFCSCLRGHDYEEIKSEEQLNYNNNQVTSENELLKKNEGTYEDEQEKIIEVLHIKIKIHEDDLKDLNEKLQRQKLFSEDIEQENNRLKEKIDDKDRLFEELMKDLSEKNKRLIKEANECENLKKESEILINDLKFAKSRIEALEKDLANALKDKDILKTKMLIIEDNQEKYLKNNKDMGAEMKKIIEENTAKDNKIKSLQFSIEEKTKELKKYKSMMDEFLLEIEKNKEIENLNKKIENLSKDKEELNVHCIELRIKLEKFRGEYNIEYYETTISDLQKRLNQQFNEKYY